MATEAKNTNYWISSSALYIQLNAMGEPDYIQCSVVSGASILCYMQGIPGLEYDAGHNYQRWPLAAYPSVFPDSERKYIYVAIPRVSTAEKNTAIVVYPSERIDLYGYSIANPDKLVGDERFYYIYLQGIISEVKTDADGKTRKRDWLQHVDCGKLNTDESLSSGIDGTWWKYNSVTDSISFLKTILSATFDTLTAKVAKITKLFLGGSELNGVADDSSLETDHTKVVTPLYLGQFGVKHFLAKDKDDVAHGTITFEKVQKFLAGLNLGDFNLENGGSWTPDAEGRSHLITDYLEVRMKAIFEELVIKKTSTIGGKEILSPAGGVVAHKVEEVTVTYNNVSQKAYRCYFLAEQEGDSVDNDFAIGDQVRSESFNVRKGTYHKVGNHFYWRLVIGRDEDPVELEGKKYHYIDLSDTDCATASDVPAKGDVLSQCGNRTDVDRQNCLIFSAVDTYSPSISLYHGINSYSFANREYVEYGVNKQTNKAFFNVYGDMYVGDRPTKENNYEGSSYIKYDSAAKQVSIKGKLSAKSTVDGKELSQYIKENSAKGLTEEQVNNLIKNSQVITDLQNQVDGAIETWFYEGVPTLKNAPASSWTTDKDKDTHLGDLYYDNKTGKAYRFAKDGNTYKWTIITDTDIAKALSDASKAQETADGKMKVFNTQPIPPYQLGDIWVNATYPTDGSIYKNEILRCLTAKAKGSSFVIGDWIKASKYTDDTVANAAKKAAEEAKKAAEKAQGDISKLETTVTDNKKAFDNYVTDGYLEPSEIAAMAQDSKRLEDDFSAAQKSYNEVKDAEVLKGTKELTDLNTAFATLTTAKKELVNYLSDIAKRYNAADTNGKATIVSAVGTKFTNFQSAYSAFYDKLGLANAYITSKIYGSLGVVIGDVTSLAYLKKALMDAPDTEINGGLVLTSLIGLRDTDGNTTAGINGIKEKSAKGGGIAAWFGGEMVDKEYNDGSKTPANTIFRFDGSGYVAGGAIWWGTDGRVHADPTSFIISEKNLGAYLTFFEPTWKAGSAGTSVADLVSLKPNAPFTKLGVSGDATFEGAITFHGIKLTYDATNKAIKIDGNLYATGGITAYGEGSGSSGGGGLNGSVMGYDDAVKLTTESTTQIASAYSIAKLKSLIDGIDGSALTEVDWSIIKNKPSSFTPSSHTHTFASLTSKPTTLSGFGISDGVNTVSVSGSGNAVTSASVSGHTLTLTKGTTFLTSHQTLDHLLSLDKRSVANTPTTFNAGIYPEFKTNSTDGLSDGGSYHGILHWRSYGTGADLSGGNPMQLAYTANGNLWTRIATSNTAWGSWKRLARAEEIPSLSGYATQSWVQNTATAHNADMVDGKHYLDLLRGDARENVMYVTNDTHFMQFGYFALTGSFSSVTLLLQSGFYGDQHSSSDIIVISGNNASVSPAYTISKVCLGGKTNRVFKYKVVNNKIYLYGYITQGNSYGLWNVKILSIDTLETWVTEFKFNVSGLSGLTDIGYGISKVANSNYATTAGSAKASDVYSWAKASTKPSYSWSEIGSRPTKLSQFTDDVVNGKYLKLSGGNLTGGLTFPISALGCNLPFSGSIEIGSTALSSWLSSKVSLIGSIYTESKWQNVISVRHGNGGGVDGPKYGMYIRTPLFGDDSLYYRTHENGTWHNERKIIDSVTIGSQSVNYANSAGSVAWGNVTNKPFNWVGQAGQPSWLWGSNDNVNFYVWNPSNFNVNSATKLTTARSLWGQTFDGTGDISGTISDIGFGSCCIRPGHDTSGLGTLNNVDIKSWWGVSFSCGIGIGVLPTDGIAMSIDCRVGDLSIYRNFVAGGGITAYSSSDIRLKQDLRKLDYFGIIKAMGGTYGFAWKKDNTRSIGWIAQHVLCNPHLKDIVETDDNGYYKINYWSPKLIATAFGAIEQVGDEVSRLKARVVFLESEVQRLSEDKEDCNKKRLDNKNINLLN